MIPPRIQPPAKSGSVSIRPAITAGVRKIPEPIVDPATMATALRKPSRRGSLSPQRSEAPPGDGGRMGAGSAIEPKKRREEGRGKREALGRSDALRRARIVSERFYS